MLYIARVNINKTAAKRWWVSYSLRATPLRYAWCLVLRTLVALCSTHFSAFQETRCVSFQDAQHHFKATCCHFKRSRSFATEHRKSKFLIKSRTHHFGKILCDVSDCFIWNLCIKSIIEYKLSFCFEPFSAEKSSSIDGGSQYPVTDHCYPYAPYSEPKSRKCK